LHQALDRQPLLRENCLKWRDRLLKLYHFDTILDMAQAQIDGRPIPSDYVKYPSKEIQTDRTTPLNALRN
jgi:hypothetical protein